ncbi:MAG: transcription-repair coupling factor [Pseudarcicella sp.]|nr:transcription-repair coupling factor [Pseudarcicella sp.]
MLVKDFLKLYKNDSLVQTLLMEIKDFDKFPSLQLKGLVGSMDTVILSALFQDLPQQHLVILQSREDASYFSNDLQNLLGEEHVLFFPMSYKKAYQYQEIDNANVLLRAEVLSRLSDIKNEKIIVVTYPEALSEKVINKQSLISNTFTIQVNNKLDTSFVGEILASYDFEKTDFVYEAGQYSVRGGIIDVFSFSNELPYRIDLFGDEVESIRTFDPESQLSIESVSTINIIPDVQTKLVKETRESFLSFFNTNARVWVKDLEQTLAVINELSDKVIENFEEIVKKSGGIQIISEPTQLFETKKTFQAQLKKMPLVEFGKKFKSIKTSEQTDESSFLVKFNDKKWASAQPSFHKDFNKVAENLKENTSLGYTNIIASDSPKQLERLEVIFEEIDSHTRFQPLNIALREGFIDHNLKIACYTDHQIFDRFHRFKEKNKFSKSKALTLKELRTLQIGDFVTHVDYGIGRFAGLDTVSIGNAQQEAMRLIYRDNDVLMVSIHSLHKIAKYSGKEGGPPMMSKLGSQDWENKKSKVKRQVKDIAKELIQLYAKRKVAPGYAFSKDTYFQAELESSFIYEDTPDQAKATIDVKNDMEKPHPMDRLVCGDVGFGKTEIAIRAAFKSVADSRQVAVLVPTTVLAMQHFRTFRDRLSELPCKVEYVNRFKSDKQIKETLKRVAAGETDILIGTHRIVNKDIVFKNLGLMIIDEEQKFGVKVKDRLKEMRVDVDVLTLTATPIPRTLHFSLMGARDLSIIATPPPNRQPVTTELHVFGDVLLRDAISYELKRNGQVYFVHNRVSELEGIANQILRLVPDAKVGIAHGQMEGDKLEKIMMNFIEGNFDVLVSTNIIESGLDIPNANTIFINHANHFGLSDLHQMRGRVGRSNKKAFCYLLTPSLSALTSDARKRLSALEEFTDLGDGFKVAMRDLDIRGAGNLLGAEQSGFVNDLGYELYHKILDEAVQELKEKEFSDLFAEELSKTTEKLISDCLIETDMNVLIPEKYVQSVSERLSLYTKLDTISNETELDLFIQTTVDRFGPMPVEMNDMVEIVKCRWVAQQLGVEKILLKNNNLKFIFVSSENERFYKSDTFGKILDYVKSNAKTCQLREIKGKLVLNFDQLLSIKDLSSLLLKMKNVAVLS